MKKAKLRRAVFYYKGRKIGIREYRKLSLRERDKVNFFDWRR